MAGNRATHSPLRCVGRFFARPNVRAEQWRTVDPGDVGGLMHPTTPLDLEPVPEAAQKERPPESSQDVPNVTETLVSASKTFIDAPTTEACLVAIYPTGPSMGTRYKLANDTLIVGREDTSDIHIDDPSVSRRHAEIRPGIAGHYIVALQSTNGTFVNDRPATVYKFKDGDYLRVGNWIFRYLSGGNVESQYHEEIYRLTILDALTGAHNKRSLLEF